MRKGIGIIATSVGMAMAITFSLYAGSEIQQERRVVTLPENEVTLCGALVYSDLWGEMNGTEYVNPITAGIYSIGATSTGNNTLVKQVTSMSKIRAAVKVNNTFYTFQSISGDNAYDDVAFVSYSATTWSQSTSKEVANTNLPSDLTYDPKTGKVYGFFYNADEDYYCKFGSLNLSTGVVSTITLDNTDVRDGSAIAANSKGEIYAIWSSIGYLMKIDPTAKTMERIGRTGIYPGDPVRGYISSMAFDDNDNLYWACTDEDGKSALYSVSTATGAATLIRNFENNEAFAGLYPLPYSTPDSAPAAAEEIHVNFTSAGALTGEVVITAPSHTTGGEALTENLNIELLINGEQSIIENVTPGSEVTSPTVTFKEGANTVQVTACTESVRGEAAELSVWAGFDAPGSPTDVTLSDKDGKPYLTWKAPTIGKNGGVFDTASVKYNVVRYPGQVSVATGITATEFTDTSFSGTAAIYYEVTATTEQGESLPAQSEKVVMGDGFSIPFAVGFDTVDDFNLWTIVDNNGGSTWEYDSNKQYIFSKYTTPDTATDDWFISPKIKMEKDKVYALKFDSKVLYSSYPENFAFYLGTSADPKDMTTKLIEKSEYKVAKFETNRVVFKSPGDGDYYLGLYTNSIPHHWELDIDNICMEEVDSRVPGKVEDLSVTPAEKGALSASIAFTMPTKDSKGNELTESLSANIYRTGSTEPIKQLTGLTAGGKVEFEDSEMTASGLMTYKVTAETEAGEGEAVEATAFVGVDAPGAVSNLKANETSEGIVLTWEAPTEGANGGYFDADNIKYRIVRSSDAEVLTDDCTALTYTDATLKLSAQELLYYLVTPYSNGVKGSYATTPMHQVYGPAFSTPFAESFPGADMSNYPWASESDGSQYVWSLDGSGSNPITSDQDGNSGLATFISTSATAGITGTFYSPKIDIRNCEDPEFSFWFYHSAATVDQNELLDLLISTDGVNFSPLSAEGVYRDNGTTGWQRHAFSLSGYKDANYIRLAFRSKAIGGANFYLDNIKVESHVGEDVELSNLSAPSKAAVGVSVDFTARLSKNSAEEVPAVRILLTADGQELGGVLLEKIAAGSSLDVTIPVAFESTGSKSVTMSAVLDSDTNQDNNSATRAITITEPQVPAVEDLASQTFNNEVYLKWDSPLKHGAVTDDVESYTDWAVSEIGDWTMIDRDYDVTYRINNDLDSYPNECSAKSFQVCNAQTIGINIWDEGTPHSGNKMFMSMACVNTVNSDWMVSPLLNGSKQTISFWAKSFTIDDDIKAERMRIYYSSTNPLPENMTQLSEGDYLEVPDEWTEYAYELPEGSKYFAIECVSDNSFALFVDDLRFNDLTVPTVEVEGYEIYRNNQKIATTTEEEYTDSEESTSTERVYRVRTLFSNGLTSDSNTVSVQTSAVSQILKDSAFDIYTIDGIIIRQSASQSDLQALPTGIYILRAGDTVLKFSK